MRRLDEARPVPSSDIDKMLEAATKAATGSNSQPVRWIVVTDAEQRRLLGDIYRECFAQIRGFYEAAPESSPGEKIMSSAAHLGERMGQVPLIIVPCAPGPPGQAGASVYPAVQNLMIAARALGLGTTLTTMHVFREAEVKAVLDVPEDYNTYAMIPVGYPLGRWGEPDRLPVAEVTFADRWGVKAEL